MQKYMWLKIICAALASVIVLPAALFFMMGVAMSTGSGYLTMMVPIGAAGLLAFVLSLLFLPEKRKTACVVFFAAAAVFALIFGIIYTAL